MTSRERIEAAVNFGQPDRPPVIAQAFGHTALLGGVDLGDYLHDGRVLAECQLRALDHYGYDAVFALMDVAVETEALGSTLEFRPGLYPTVKDPAVLPDGQVDRLQLPDPTRDGRMPELLRAARLLREEVADDVLVVGCVVGPLTLAIQLMGAENGLFLAVDEPARFEKLLDFATEVAIEFGCAQLAAGVHVPLVFDPSSSPLVVPPSFFREFEAPRLQRLFTALREHGTRANWLHVAGPTDPILPLYADLGVDIANFDYCVGAATAQQALPKTCLDGNLRPLAFVDETPAEIESAAHALLEAFAARGGFILSSGCEIPPTAHAENIAALVAAVR